MLVREEVARRIKIQNILNAIIFLKKKDQNQLFFWITKNL